MKPTKLIYNDKAHSYYVDGQRWPGMSNYGGQIENQSNLIPLYQREVM